MNTNHRISPGNPSAASAPAWKRGLASPVSEDSVSAREREGFPAVPESWYYLGSSQDLNRQPIRAELGSRLFVGYRTASGRAVVLSGRCSHLGAHLDRGTVDGERLVCPLHGWEYGPDGRCGRIPASDAIPDFARQDSFPVKELGGHVFFYTGREARFSAPFFEGLTPEELRPARPFELIAEAPWYFVGANGFDIQHYRMAHDRILVGQPEVTQPSPFARRIVAIFDVSGRSLRDSLLRLVAGPRVTMDVTSWCGTVILVRAQLDRTTSYGMFNVLPLDPHRTLGRVIVWVRRSRGWMGRLGCDALSGAIRRMFIRGFLQSDLPRIAGLRYRPENLIAADETMAAYFAWLRRVCVEPGK